MYTESMQPWQTHFIPLQVVIHWHKAQVRSWLSGRAQSIGSETYNIALQNPTWTTFRSKSGLHDELGM